MPVFKLNNIFAGRYRLDELLGEGDCKEVWKAKDQLADDTEVTLKIYSPEKGLEDYGVRQFRREFALSHRLFHPHLLKISQFDVWEGSPYLLMPCCSGGSLNRLLEEEGPLSERQVALVLCQIGSALDELHSQEPPILHQEVKPTAILISQPGYFLLTGPTPHSQERNRDLPSNAEPKPVTGPYAPPESFDRSQRSDTSGDIFSLGLTLFEMCTQRLPWNGVGGKALLKGEDVPKLPEDYSAELNELLQACLSVDSSKRPTAAELHLRGRHFLDSGSWSLPDKESSENKSLKRFIPFLLATAVFALFVISAYWGYKNDHLNIPAERLQQMATPLDQEQEIDQMLIVTMEAEMKELARRTVELEEENKQLRRMRSLSKSSLESREQLMGEYQSRAEKNEEPGTLNKPGERTTAPVSSAPSKEGHSLSLAKELQEQLNKISDPGLSAAARSAWKQETMGRFAEGAVRIVDISEGEPKNYAAGIFLNLLSNVPHHVVVKEVKSNQNRKITELRLSMEAKR